MKKNQAGQRWTLYAFDNQGQPVDGDAANISACLAKDDVFPYVPMGGTVEESDATNAKGFYTILLEQAETNATKLAIAAKSITSGVTVIGIPAVIYTDSPRNVTIEVPRT